MRRVEKSHLDHRLPPGQVPVRIPRVYTPPLDTRMLRTGKDETSPFLAISRADGCDQDVERLGGLPPVILIRRPSSDVVEVSWTSPGLQGIFEATIEAA